MNGICEADRTELDFDFVFVGAGLSSTMTMINLLEIFKRNGVQRKVRIAVIEKSGEFFSGIPYGDRAGFNSLIITSLKDFLPEPHLSKFKHWLNQNVEGLIETFCRRNGDLSSAWLNLHQQEICDKKWDHLFVPRHWFGVYLKDTATRCLNEAERKGLVEFKLIDGDVFDVTKENESYSVSLVHKNDSIGHLSSQAVVLGLGSPPLKRLLDFDPHDKDGLQQCCLIDNPYEPGLESAMSNIARSLEESGDSAVNVLLIGSNASAIEALYNCHDFQFVSERINKIFVISESGEFPERLTAAKKNVKYVPSCLGGLASQEKVTALDIYEASCQDVINGQNQALSFSDTYGPIALAMGRLLKRLPAAEKLVFANAYGAELGKLQRRTGDEYRDVVDQLVQEKKLEFVKGRFESCQSIDGQGMLFSYRCAKTRELQTYPERVRVAINCGGFEGITVDNSSSLLANLLKRGLCEATPSKAGLVVDDQYQANRNLFVIGPMLAGNVIKGSAVWHVEHCGRIMQFTEQVAKLLYAASSLSSPLDSLGNGGCQNV